MVIDRSHQNLTLRVASKTKLYSSTSTVSHMTDLIADLVVVGPKVTMLVVTCTHQL